MKHRRIIVLAISTLMILTLPLHAQEKQNIVSIDSLQKDLSSMAKVFAGLSSYSCDATLTVSTPDEFMDFLALKGDARADAKIGHYNVKVLATTNELSVERRKFGANGQLTEARTIYANPKEVALKVVDQENVAKIVQVKPDQSNLPLYWDPVFLAYGFLTLPSRGEDGQLGTMMISSLSDPNVWKEAASAVKEVNISANGHIQATLNHEGRTIIVEFTKDEKTGHYLPTVVKCLFKSNQVRTKVEVLEYNKAADLVPVPSKVNLTTYIESPHGDPVTMANWQFDLKSISINPKIDEDDIRFDPASVDMIWDDAHQVFIRVPH